MMLTRLIDRDATPYLPSDVKTVDDESLKPRPPIACSFGPFGKQTRLELNMFDTVKICAYTSYCVYHSLKRHAAARFFNGSKSHVFNAGAPVWALDWCPIHPDDRPRKSQTISPRLLASTPHT